jgi:2-polyprenyl-6-methoxyphenol hydroxylase-like FAD-dependent oxidoreductase
MSVTTTSVVVVVGAGPVGLTLACELARRDVAIRVVDKLPVATTESRAILVHARSLEMFERMGIVDDLIASGVRTIGMDMFADRRRLARLSFDEVDSPFPFSVTTAQTETERLLTERLSGLGVRVERGVQATALEQDASGVEVTLRHPDGREERVGSQWIVGADGAHSTVRAALGAKLVGSFKGQRFLLGDVDAAYDCSRDRMQTFFTKNEGALLVFPMEGERLRLIAEVPAEPLGGEAATGEPSLEALQAIVDRRAHNMRLLNARWLTYFEIHHAQVPAYRVGRAFLAGDAAHVHSPAGGQGMNTGMQDAFNLGWKLALASQGIPGAEALLDSYGAERHPIAARVIHDSTVLTNAGTVRSPLARHLRNAGLRVASKLGPVQHRIAAEIAETDLSYRGSPTVTGRTSGTLQAGDAAPDVPGTNLRHLLGARIGHAVLHFPGRASAAAIEPVEGVHNILINPKGASAGAFDDVVDDSTGSVARRYAMVDGGHVAVRPDGYIAFLGSRDDTAALEAYLNTYARPRPHLPTTDGAPKPHSSAEPINTSI